MCTAFKYKQYFCRNYDYEQSYNEVVKLIPKNSKYKNKYDVMGICTGLIDDYPLMYDGINEYGLCMGGLAFNGNAYYVKQYTETKGRFAYFPYEFILQILGNFKTVDEVKKELEKAVMVDIPYSKDFPNTDLHWMISDKEKSIVVEATKDGLNVYDNEYETLTNNPPFNEQIEYYEMDFIGEEESHYIRERGEEWNTRGLETQGLSGGYTSPERFERITYLKDKAKDDKFNPLTQAMHLLSSVEQIYGATPVGNNYEYTIYSAIYDMENKKLHIKTYDRTMYLTYQFLNDKEPVTFKNI